jgi:DNA topoisomerase-1
MTITADRAIELIKAKRQADIDKYIKSFPENPGVQLLNGRWGPYLVIDKNNYKIPKGVDAATLSLQECLDIAADPKNASKGNRFKKKEIAKPVKKAAVKEKKKAVKKASSDAIKTTAKKAVKTALKGAKKAPKKAAKKSVTKKNK